jgi:predicted enzyme related to lactoylglutathione lyase
LGRRRFNSSGRAGLEELASLEVEKAGGKIIAPKFKIGEVGWIATIMDTEGNTVGLHSFK